MADKAGKAKKKAKAKKDDNGVLAALPSKRPERIGGDRRAATTAARPKRTAAAKPATRASAKPATRASAKPATRATATRRKAAAPRTFEPTEAAEQAAGGADERAAGASKLAEQAAGAAPQPAEPRRTRPRPVREGAPGIGTTTGEREQAGSESGRPSGVDLATTAVKAAGEVAQLGLTLGGHVLKRVVDRLPKP
jgi:hypothetical protein